MIGHRPEAIQRFRETFAGDVVLPADAGYEDARRVWNGMIDRRPALIVRPTNPDDVAAAVRFGRDNSLVIAVRGGGHSLPGFSTCDDGIVIDLSRMRGVDVDAANETARVNGGALLPSWTPRRRHRSGLPGWGGRAHRRRWPDPGWRNGSAAAALRAHDRQRACGRAGDG